MLCSPCFFLQARSVTVVKWLHWAECELEKLSTGRNICLTENDVERMCQDPLKRHPGKLDGCNGSGA